MSATNDTASILLARRAELVQELEQIEDDLDEPMPKDWDDRSSERQSDEVLESLGQHDLAELQMIDAALKRVENGTYGVCVRCQEKISIERLAVIPETPICKNCAQADAA